MHHEVTNCRPFLGVALEHPLDQVLQQLGVALRDALDLPCDDFCGEGEMVCGLKRRFQGHHLVEDATG